MRPIVGNRRPDDASKVQIRRPGLVGVVTAAHASRRASVSRWRCNVTCRLAVALVASLVMAAGGPLHAETLLRWKLQPKQQFDLIFDQQTNAKTTIKSGSVDADVSMAMTLRWTVDRVLENGSFEITQRIQRLKMTTRIGDGDAITYDSQLEEQASEEAREIADAMSPILEAGVTITMTPRGEITDVDFPAKSAEALGNLPAASSFRQALSREGIQQLLGQTALVLPEDPVSSGDEWSQSRRVGSPQGVVTLKSDYAFRGQQDDGGEQILVESEIALPKSIDSRTFRIVEQSQTGDLRFDPEQGRLLRSRVSQQLKTERQYRDMAIVVMAKSTVSLKITPVE